MSNRRKAVAVLLACILGWSLGMSAGQAGEINLQTVSLALENRKAGDSNVLIPKLSGHPDAEITQRINEDIAAQLHIDEALLALGRAADWAGDDGDDAGIHMESSVYLTENVLSLAVSTRGELPDGSFGQAYTALNYDLLTGEALRFADLFTQPDEAAARMEDMITATLAEDGLNSYLEHDQILPMPRENFSLSANGLIVYYPGDQYRLLDGQCGAFYFLYYQLEPYMKADNPLCELLLAQRAAPEDPAEQVRRDVAAGKLPGIPVELGAPLETYIERYHLLTDPDYTYDGPLYQFTAPQLQGVLLGGPLYPEEGQGEGAVTAIRTALIDLYGLRPGVSTLADVENLLGEPDERTELSETDAPDMLLPAGVSYWYDEGGHRLEMHANADGLLTHVILHAGA